MPIVKKVGSSRTASLPCIDTGGSRRNRRRGDRLVLGRRDHLRRAGVRGQGKAKTEEQGSRGMRTTKKAIPSHNPSLQRFALEDLAPFTKEGIFSKSASRDFHLFYADRPGPWRVLRTCRLRHLAARGERPVRVGHGRRV
jgi:hypothetical protein